MTIANPVPITLLNGTANDATQVMTNFAAIVADVNANAAGLASANVFTKAQTVTPVALTDAATIATNAALSNNFTVLLTAAVGATRVLSNPTNLTNGCIYNWRIKQSSAGNNAMTYGTKFKWPGGTAPVLTIAANGIDLICGQYYGDTDTLLCTTLKAFA